MLNTGVLHALGRYSGASEADLLLKLSDLMGQMMDSAVGPGVGSDPGADRY